VPLQFPKHGLLKGCLLGPPSACHYIHEGVRLWRGYWAQRLLWEIGGSVCFIPPTVEQHRNIHTLVHDFEEERDLYNDAGRLVDFLRAWEFKGNHFPDALQTLSPAMAEEGFWGQGDVDLTTAWIQVLTPS
jgi:hypothetical protein